jgi:hypothetical protein
MVYLIRGCRLKEGIWYRGVITDYKANKKRLVIVVRFDKDEDVDYIKYLPISENKNSQFGKTMEELDVIDEYGRIDTEELLDMRIVGTLRKGKDGLLYVNRIYIDEDYYDELEDEKYEEYEEYEDDEDEDDEDEDDEDEDEE